MVVQGAICKCTLSVEPKTDLLKVKTHSKHFANEKATDRKFLATTKETGKTLEKNTFGKCKNQPLPNNDYNICMVDIIEWKDFYEKVTLSNDGKILLEDSKATCKMGIPNCIEIIDHGQIAEPSEQNFKKANPDVQNKINPLLNLNDAGKTELNFNGIEQQ